MHNPGGYQLIATLQQQTSNDSYILDLLVENDTLAVDSYLGCHYWFKHKEYPVKDWPLVTLGMDVSLQLLPVVLCTCTFCHFAVVNFFQMLVKESEQTLELKLN